jgi:MerR family copper efflux transcriptional regulator
VDKMRIAELAAVTGFSTPTLRYYEQLGLLEPAERSESGYRMYGEREVERVRFIGRAKRLGLSLEEIRSLVGVWAGGECAVTRRQLRVLVEAKIDAVRQQIDEAATFLAQLEAVDDRLAELLTSGRTADGCECAPELPHIQLVHIDPRPPARAE